MVISRATAKNPIETSSLKPHDVRELSGAYKELKNINLATDLDKKFFHVSADGWSWRDVSVPDLKASEFVEFYYQMSLTRAVDNEIVKMMRKGIAFGKHLMCTGNEATAVGAATALRNEEWATLAIRDLGVYVARGVPITDILAQASGRVPGLTNGWDGSLHMGSRATRIAGLVSHLGTMPCVATGCAFANRFRGSDCAVLAFIGDGTTSTGDVHEALNIASVLRLPVVFLIENNQWAFGTPTRLQYAVPTLALRALAYGSNVEGYWIDGTNVTTVHEVVSLALERARQNQTISIIEAVSMRLEGHSLADPFKTYIPKEQLVLWQAKDPISTFKERLIAEEIATDDELKAVDARIVDEVRASAIEAEESPTPDPNNIEQYVFAPSGVFGTALSTPPETGQTLTYHQGIQDGLREEMDRDSSLFMIGEDIGISNGAFKVTEGFSARYDGIDWDSTSKINDSIKQRRVIDAPIAEAGFCGLALGSVLEGLRVVVEFQYADFSSEAFKMLVNYAATQTSRRMGPVPIVFRMPSGWAPKTSMYHSVNPESWFASTPGLKIVAPITAFDAKGLLKAAIRDGNPVLYLEYKAYYRISPDKLPPQLNLQVPEDDYVVPLGKARVVKEGNNLSVITYGSQVIRALEAAEVLAQEDKISVEIIDLRTLVPFDSDCIQRSIEKTSRALVTCEAPRTGCFGNTIVTDITRTSFKNLDAPIKLVAAADTPVPFSPALEEAHLPTVEKLVSAMREIVAY